MLVKERDSTKKQLAKRTTALIHTRENVRENVFRDNVYAGTHPICRTWIGLRTGVQGNNE